MHTCTRILLKTLCNVVRSVYPWCLLEEVLSLLSKNCYSKKIILLLLLWLVIIVLNKLAVNGVLNSVHYVKNPGAVLEPGSIVAKLELDDPSKVTQVM